MRVAPRICRDGWGRMHEWELTLESIDLQFSAFRSGAKLAAQSRKSRGGLAGNELEAKRGRN